MSAGSFVVRPATAEDAEDIVRIELAALKDHSRLFPGSVADADGFVSHQVRNNRKSTSDHNGTPQWLVAQDSKTGELAAVLRWETVGDMSVTPHQTITDTGPYGNAGTAAFFDVTTVTRRDYMGDRSHIYVHIFATDPQHQRRGAGGSLLRHILKQADVERKPVYLESSPMAVLVYKKLGFVETGVKVRFPDGDETNPPEFWLTVVAREPVALGSELT